MMAKDSALSKNAPPGRMVTGWPPAFTISGSSSPFAGGGPKPIKPFSDWSVISIPGGINAQTSVGRPMPKLTTSPSISSWAMRYAIRFLLSLSAIDFSSLNYEVHEKMGGHYMIRINLPCFHNLLHFHDHRFCCHGHNGVEIAGALLVNQVAFPVCLPGLDQGKVCLKGFF